MQYIVVGKKKQQDFKQLLMLHLQSGSREREMGEGGGRVGGDGEGEKRMHDDICQDGLLRKCSRP